MFSKKLAELFVEINALGVKATTDELARLKEKSEAAMKSLNESAGAASNFGAKTLAAYDVARNAIRGFYDAGIAGTAEMTRFGIQLQFLSREVASIFTPVLEQMTGYLERVVHWFQNLSLAQQDSLLWWSKAIVGAVTFSMVVPKVTAALAAAIPAVISLTSAFIGLDVASGGILPIIGAVVTGIGALIIGTETGRNMLGGFFSALEPIFRALQDALGDVFDAFVNLGETVMASFKIDLDDVIDTTARLIMLIGKLAGALNYLASKWTDVANAMERYGGIAKAILPAWLGAGLDAASAVKKAGVLPDLPEKKKGGHRTAAFGDIGFEDVSAAYKRIQTMMAKTQKTTAEEQLDAQRKIEENTARTADNVTRVQPGMA